MCLTKKMCVEGRGWKARPFLRMPLPRQKWLALREQQAGERHPFLRDRDACTSHSSRPTNLEPGGLFPLLVLHAEELALTTHLQFLLLPFCADGFQCSLTPAVAGRG